MGIEKMNCPSLKFCNENDLMTPICSVEEQKLAYHCSHCGETIPASPKEYCVYRADYSVTKEITTNFANMVADPTIPSTKEIDCPKCSASQAVYLVEMGSSLSLQYQC